MADTAISTVRAGPPKMRLQEANCELGCDECDLGCAMIVSLIKNLKEQQVEMSATLRREPTLTSLEDIRRLDEHLVTAYQAFAQRRPGSDFPIVHQVKSATFH